MVSVQNISIQFGSKPILNNINFVINKKDKIALVGKNGAGKSTLLKIIKGLIPPTSGNIAVPKDFTIGYLPQQMELTDNLTVIEEVKKSLSFINELNSKIKNLQTEIASRTDYDSPAYGSLIEQLSTLSDRVMVEEAENKDAVIEKTLLGLGFERADFNRNTSEFSGGWRMRIELAKILIEQPNLILLDEPTNHLDIESIQWLENYLISKPSAVVLVSHDKAFVDNITNRTIEITGGKIYDYNVNYSKFIELRKERVEQQMRAYLNQQKQIQDTQDFIERFRYKATKSVQVQSRIKQLAKIELIEIDEIDNSAMSLKFPPAPRSGDYPLIIEGLSKNYDEHKVLKNVDLTLKRGDKIALVGKNGAGKSTLIKCIMSEIEFCGTLKIGHNVKIGYFAQNQAQLLDGDITVFDTIDRIAVGDIRKKIRDILGAFMFGGEESEKKVRVLSGGEKSRLAMIKLLLEPVNLLILDEPTNHLDIKSKEVLKHAIKEFTGTVIVVSHDRDFLNGLVDKVYEFSDGSIRENIGGIYEFLNKKNPPVFESFKRQQIQQPSLKAKDKTRQEKTIPEQPATGNSKLSYFEQKEKEKAIKSQKKKILSIESDIESLEVKLKELENKFSNDSVESGDFENYQQLKRRLEDSMSIWEIYNSELETLQNNFN